MRRAFDLLKQFGFNPANFFLSIKGIPVFFLEYLKYWRLSGYQSTSFSPIFLDKHKQAGSANGHYFWQDLIAARWIHQFGPSNHLDIGSRIDGFVAHLMSFREVSILDIRPLDISFPGLTQFQGNAQKNLKSTIGTFDSVSCLHAIEHFGLGRYGDPIDPSGHEKGLVSISELVEKGGRLYISFPVGKQKVEFNSQRILKPDWPTRVLVNFVLEEFVLIPWKGQPKYGLSPHEVDLDLFGQCGLYRFKRE